MLRSLVSLASALFVGACGASTVPATDAPPATGTAPDPTRRPAPRDPAAVAAPPPPAAPTAADTLYRPASETDGDRSAVLVRDLDELGETPVGMTAVGVRLRYGVPDADETYTLGQDWPGGELRVEVYNTTRERQARGETVRVREMTWRLPHGWIRKVWVHDAPDGWRVADGVEWAADRVDF